MIAIVAGIVVLGLALLARDAHIRHLAARKPIAEGDARVVEAQQAAIDALSAANALRGDVEALKRQMGALLAPKKR